MANATAQWTNKSVLALQVDDPVDAIVSMARNLALNAADRGWAGPPFDPFELARLMGISVIPRSDIRDARSLIDRTGTKRIEFNPNKGAARIRFSIAHEIAHTLFPDFGSQPRHRNAGLGHDRDEWQLEALCNLAAAEMLMPATLFSNADRMPASMRSILQEQSRFDVSIEAVLLRLARLSKNELVVFVAHRQSDDDNSYQIDYWKTSSTWRGPQLTSDTPIRSTVSLCTAVGFTAESAARWGCDLEIKVSCVGLPPYPGHKFPRVAGFLRRSSEEQERSFFNVIVGNALEPLPVPGERMLLQVVNDRAGRWGGGLARGARTKWPEAAASFGDWAKVSGNLRLGGMHTAPVEDELTLVSMVAQRGYGPSRSPRIRYRDLADCLRQVAQLAKERGASIHMPRIGTGLAGGNWWVIQELVEDILCSKGLEVTVYELPQQGAKDPLGQLPLPL